MEISYHCPKCNVKVTTDKTKYLYADIAGHLYTCKCKTCHTTTTIRLNSFNTLKLSIDSLKQFFFN